MKHARMGAAGAVAIESDNISKCMHTNSEYVNTKDIVNGEGVPPERILRTRWLLARRKLNQGNAEDSASCSLRMGNGFGRCRFSILASRTYRGLAKLYTRGVPEMRRAPGVDEKDLLRITMSAAYRSTNAVRIFWKGADTTSQHPELATRS